MSKFEKGGEYYNSINKVWSFFKENIQTKTDKDWDILIGRFKEFNSPLEQDLLISVVNEIERSYKNVKS